MLSQKFLKISCSEIASETIFVLKFIFGLNAARILTPSVFGASIAMLHGGSHMLRVSMSDVGIAVD